jgi:hypothetical protein
MHARDVGFDRGHFDAVIDRLRRLSAVRKRCRAVRAGIHKRLDHAVRVFRQGPPDAGAAPAVRVLRWRQCGLGSLCRRRGRILRGLGRFAQIVQSGLQLGDPGQRRLKLGSKLADQRILLRFGQASKVKLGSTAMLNRLARRRVKNFFHAARAAEPSGR